MNLLIKELENQNTDVKDKSKFLISKMEEKLKNSDNEIIELKSNKESSSKIILELNKKLEKSQEDSKLKDECLSKTILQLNNLEKDKMSLEANLIRCNEDSSKNISELNSNFHLLKDKVRSLKLHLQQFFWKSI